jgi:hypothetical protein
MDALSQLDGAFGAARQKRERESRAEEANDFASMHYRPLARSSMIVDGDV